MSHETMKINRHEKFDEDEGEIEIAFKYRAGRPALGPSFNSPGEPAEDDEIEILKITNESGKDITDLVSAYEYQHILETLYEDWEDTNADDMADYRYEQSK